MSSVKNDPGFNYDVNNNVEKQTSEFVIRSKVNVKKTETFGKPVRTVFEEPSCILHPTQGIHWTSAGPFGWSPWRREEKSWKTLVSVSSVEPPKNTSNVTVTLPLYAKIVVVLPTAQQYTVNQILVFGDTLERTAGRAPEHSRMLATPGNRATICWCQDQTSQTSWVLMRFHTEPIGIMADVQKMFYS